ncbi:MAG: hypothetical protein QME81_11125 [bacterium]|nr:hypothetical protein [bacterium]
MPVLEVNLPSREFGILTTIAANAGVKPAEIGARILKMTLDGRSAGGDLDNLEVKRAIAGVCADRSPWNNEVDAEWNDWQL